MRACVRACMRTCVHARVRTYELDSTAGPSSRAHTAYVLSAGLCCGDDALRSPRSVDQAMSAARVQGLFRFWRSPVWVFGAES
eukprot:2093993-Alexandrium_andersonii.AAC.1